MPAAYLGTPDGAAALLIETRAVDEARWRPIWRPSRGPRDGVNDFVRRRIFPTDPKETAIFWNVRKGVFPAVAAVRPPGTTVIIEDVAFKIEDLAAGVLGPSGLFVTHGYTGCCIYGHALDGNMHFVIYPRFLHPANWSATAFHGRRLRHGGQQI